MEIPKPLYLEIKNEIDPFYVEKLEIEDKFLCDQLFQNEKTLLTKLKIKILQVYEEKCDYFDCNFETDQFSNLNNLEIEIFFYFLFLQKTDGLLKRLLGLLEEDLGLLELKILETILDYGILITKNRSAIENSNLKNKIVETVIKTDEKGIYNKILHDIVPKFCKFTQNNSVLALFYDKIDKNSILDIICILEKEFFSSDGDKSFDLLSKNSFWELLNDNLVGPNKKRALFLLKKAIFLRKHQSNELKTAWKYFFVMFDASKEKQLHLILPILNLYDNLGPLPLIWKVTLTKQFIFHSQNAVVKKTVLKMLENHWDCPMELLAVGLNNTFLYDSEDILRALAPFFSNLVPNKFFELLLEINSLNFLTIPTFFILKNVNLVPLEHCKTQNFLIFLEILSKTKNIYVQNYLFLIFLELFFDIFQKKFDKNGYELVEVLEKILNHIDLQKWEPYCSKNILPILEKLLLSQLRSDSSSRTVASPVLEKFSCILNKSPFSSTKNSPSPTEASPILTNLDQNISSKHRFDMPGPILASQIQNLDVSTGPNPSCSEEGHVLPSPTVASRVLSNLDTKNENYTSLNNEVSVKNRVYNNDSDVYDDFPTVASRIKVLRRVLDSDFFDLNVFKDEVCKNSGFYKEVFENGQFFNKHSYLRFLFLKSLMQAFVLDKNIILEWRDVLVTSILNCPLFSRDQRIEFEMCGDIEKYYNENQNFLDSALIECVNYSEIDSNIRLLAIVLGLVIGEQFSYTAGLKYVVTQLQSRYNQIAGKRYYENSQNHFIKLRILQFFNIILDYISEKNDLNNLLDWLFQNLVNEPHQTNIKILIQWLLSKILIKLNQNSQENCEFLLSKAKNLQGASVSTVFPIMYNTLKQCEQKMVHRVIKFLASYTMGPNFKVRYAAQVAIKNIYERIPQVKSNGSFQIIYETAVEAIAETSSDNVQDRFDLAYLDLTEMSKFDTFYYHLPRLTGVERYQFAKEDFTNLKKIVFGVFQEKIDSGISLVLEKINFTNKSLENLEFSKKNFVHDDEILTFHQNFENNVQKKYENIPNQKQINPNLILVASLIDKIPNLGGLSRTCEIFGIKKLILNNVSIVKNKEFQNLSMSSENWVCIEEFKIEGLPNFLKKMKDIGYQVVGAEQTADSQKLDEFKFERDTVLVLGNEKEGIPPNLIHLMDVCLEIPQFGQLKSLNVHVAGALLIWEYTKQISNKDRDSR